MSATILFHLDLLMVLLELLRLAFPNLLSIVFLSGEFAALVMMAALLLL